ncbi:hypothetical protein BJ875DRAFT_463196 [Amylocarpus encephaloides]|uniref:Uncharacterized protein n=1 Tax=Amylocarpus encephaloides TaxID=45428 RepID=A0A9P7YIT9_9HELO|nr:hypothetical protein BJ875DRAFT_463196 [Amylocarpus encephaloides]
MAQFHQFSHRTGHPFLALSPVVRHPSLRIRQVGLPRPHVEARPLLHMARISLVRIILLSRQWASSPSVSRRTISFASSTLLLFAGPDANTTSLLIRGNIETTAACYSIPWPRRQYFERLWSVSFILHTLTHLGLQMYLGFIACQSSRDPSQS